MAIDYCDEVGWPAVATPVRVERERIFPRLVRKERRERLKLIQIAYYERHEERLAERWRLNNLRYRTGETRERYLALRNAREREKRSMER